MTNNKTVIQRILPPWLNGTWGLAFTLYTLAYMAWLYFRWGGEENVTLIGDLLYLPSNLVVVVAAWRVVTRKDLEPHIRRMWLLLGIGFVSYFLGSLSWTYLENVLEVPPFPSIADFFYLLFMPLAAIGLFSMPGTPLSKRERRQYAIDMLIVMITTIILMWYFVIQPTAAAYTGDPLTQIIAAAYPITDVIIIFGVVGALLRHPGRDTKSALWFIFFAMLIFVGADVVFGITSLAGTYGPGSLADYGWAIAFLLFLFAALRQVYRAPADSAESHFAKILDGFARLLPYIVAILGGLIAIIVIATNFNAQTGWLIAGALLVVVLVLSRQLWETRIQTRLTSLVLIVTVPLLVGVTTYINSRAGQTIEENANLHLEDDNNALAINVSSWLEQQTQTLNEMAALPDITSMDADRQRPTLQVIAAAHPNLFLVHTTDLSGTNIARNDEEAPKDYHDRNWFLGARDGAPITIEALISRTTGKPALNFSTPIRDQYDRIVGVASIVSQLDEISREVLNPNEDRGITFIIDPKNRVIAHPDPAYTTDELRDLSAYPPVAALRNGQTGLLTFTDDSGKVWRAYVSTLDNGWGIITQQPEAELLAPVLRFQRVAILFIVIGALTMFALAWFTIRRTLQPIGTLTDTVSAIAAGDLNRTAEVKSQDEVGTLASTFNAMTSRLRESIDTLEQRVTERTRNLLLAAEVSRSVTQVRALDIMLKDACELILKEFNLYYVQVYLADASGSTLKLEAGTGSVGTQLVERGHSLPIDTGSINGRAAVEKRSVLISDTSTSATFRQNPLLPETRGEMAVPLIVADKMVGVLDMQSNTPDTLTDQALPTFEALAGQLAVAIQNANLLAEAEQARAQMEAQARRLVREGWKEHLDAIHKPEQLGFVFAQNKVAPLAGRDEVQIPDNSKAVSAPIAVTGEPLGSLVVELEDEARREQTGELVNIVARQVAQQIENLRLLESAERYRFEAEQASRRLTREGWEGYVASKSEVGLGYIYDLNEVKPHNQAQSDITTDKPVTELPLKVHEEVIGSVAVIGLDEGDESTLNLANEIVERLSVHIENLRLSEQTQKRAAELATVAEISTAATTLLNPEELLQSVVDTAREKFGLYHAHVYLRDAETNALVLAKGAGEVGHQMVADQWQIEYDHPTSMVARSARTAEAVIANDIVRDVNSPFLSNKLLPNTRSEMAVPMIIGDTVMGVFDVQSDVPNRFTGEDVSIFNSLAAQIAIALQNARAFTQAQRQAEREATLNAINRKIQSATSVEAVLQIAARELGRAFGAPLTIAQLGLRPGNDNGN